MKNIKEFQYNSDSQKEKKLFTYKLRKVKRKEKKKGGELDLPWVGEEASLGEGQRVGVGSESRLLAPSSSRASHLRRRFCPVLAVSGRMPVRRIEAILAVISEAGGPLVVAEEGELEIKRGSSGQPYLSLLLEAGGNRGISPEKTSKPGHLGLE